MSLREWQAQLGTVLLRPNPEKALSSAKVPHTGALALYQELLFNTVCGTVESIYPFTHQVLTYNQPDDSQWQGWVDAYRRAYPNRSYSLIGAICDFPEFLERQPALMVEFPFIADLARYEWLEMAVLNDPEPDFSADLEPMVPEIALFGQYQPVWNPIRRLQTFSYQIPTLLDAWKASPQSVLESPALFQGELDVLIYRDFRTLDARFFVVNALTATLLRLSASGASYEAGLTALQAGIPALSQLPTDVLKEHARGLLENCLDQGILWGSVPVSSPV
ncbi:HvfC/BufC family peptide modification chaperone [Vampirovibrio chlorellavorus]|uniref:HvfC/BufC family peptide modification chaperone n=1 Tax=Vampirovibrio chlorellavorus TaxID=758823 RepID=UPI0026EC9CAD|nr:putative DNA-binding domain-containing protein [Vampirovibrio chlorellavorus]